MFFIAVKSQETPENTINLSLLFTVMFSVDCDAFCHHHSLTSVIGGGSIRRDLFVRQKCHMMYDRLTFMCAHTDPEAENPN